MNPLEPVAALSFSLDGTPQPAIQVLCPEHGNILTTYVVFGAAGMWVERSPTSNQRQVARAKKKHADSPDQLAPIREVLRHDRRKCRKCRRTVPDTGPGTDNDWLNWLYRWAEIEQRVDSERPTLRVTADEHAALHRQFGMS